MKQDQLTPRLLAEYVVACQKGDRGAFETLFTETVPWVTCTVRGILCDPQAVDECVQEIYLTVWKKIRFLRDPQSFLAWLKRIAVNLSLRKAEKQKRRKREAQPLSEETQTASSPAPDQTVVARLELQAALRKLSVKERAILVVRELHGASYEELARLFSVPIGTVRSRLSSAKKKATRYLTREEAR